MGLNFFEFRDLYVYEDSKSDFVLLKSNPFIWDSQTLQLVNGKQFEYRNPNLKLKWISEIQGLDWSLYLGKNLKPVLAHLHRTLQWAQDNDLSRGEIKNLIRKEFLCFSNFLRFPFDPLRRDFNFKASGEE